MTNKQGKQTISFDEIIQSGKLLVTPPLPGQPSI